MNLADNLYNKFKYEWKGLRKKCWLTLFSADNCVFLQACQHHHISSHFLSFFVFIFSLVFYKKKISFFVFIWFNSVPLIFFFSFLPDLIIPAQLITFFFSFYASFNFSVTTFWFLFLLFYQNNLKYYFIFIFKYK